MLEAPRAARNIFGGGRPSAQVRRVAGRCHPPPATHSTAIPPVTAPTPSASKKISHATSSSSVQPRAPPRHLRVQPTPPASPASASSPRTPVTLRAPSHLASRCRGPSLPAAAPGASWRTPPAATPGTSRAPQAASSPACRRESGGAGRVCGRACRESYRGVLEIADGVGAREAGATTPSELAILRPPQRMTGSLFARSTKRCTAPRSRSIKGLRLRPAPSTSALRKLTPWQNVGICALPNQVQRRGAFADARRACHTLLSRFTSYNRLECSERRRTSRIVRRGASSDVALKRIRLPAGVERRTICTRHAKRCVAPHCTFGH